MANLQNKRIKDTYEGLIKTTDNNAISGEVELTDGSGNGTGVSVSTDGRVVASGTVSFGSLKDTGENITITKFVDEADGIANNDNDTSIPTVAAVKDYVDSTELDTVTSVNTQTGDVVLGTDNISEGSSNLYYTEDRVNANTNVAANTLKNTYPTADANKVGHITVTQAVNLDTIESNVATNNAKVSFNSSASSKLSGIESGAEVNVKSNWNETDTNSDAYIIGKPTIPTAAVDSVNTQIGNVVLDTDDIAEGTSNLYYTDARVSANTNVTANTAKVGITTQQASDITTNNAKVSITTQQAADIVTNNAKVGITTQQASDITANNSKVGITTTQADAITANTAKVGITTEQSNAIATNTAKVGITTQQSSDIVTNNAKVGITTTQANEITANTSKVGITTQQASDITTNNAKVGITTQQASDITSNNAKVGITTTQANNITANTAKISYNTTDSTKVGYISISQAVDLDVVENKQDNQYKIIGIAMDYSNRVLSDNGTAEGSQSIMENIETLILN